MQDRRQHRRVAIEVEVDLESSDNFFTGKARDLSIGGVFIETAVGLPIGGAVGVHLTVGAESFTIACEVMWTLGDASKGDVGVGLRFLALTPKERSAIDAFMAERPPIGIEAPGQLPPPLPKS